MVLFFSLISTVGMVVAQDLKVFEVPIIRIPTRQSFITAVNLGVGTPPQNMIFILDSGSSDLWVPQTNSALCRNANQQCSGTPFVTGSFDPAKSTSLMTVQQNGPFFTNYVNGVSINGTFITETIQLGGKAVVNSQIGLGTDGNLPSELFPIAGIGYPNFEGIIQLGQKPYPNLIAGMKAIGAIKSASFAMYLNDFRSAQGSLLIGGVDSAKFTGSLQTIPLAPDMDGGFTTFFVAWTSFTSQSGGAANISRTMINSCKQPASPRRGSRKQKNNGAINGGEQKQSSGNRNNKRWRQNKRTTEIIRRQVMNPVGDPQNNASMPGCMNNLVPDRGLPEALIDSGNPGISVPTIIAQAMGVAVGATLQDGTLSPVPCSVGDNASRYTFGFANTMQIDVPLSLLLLPLTNADGTPFTNQQGQALCDLPVDIIDNYASLGAAFMQAAYIVFDMDRNQLLMAQAKINTTESRIQEYV